MKEPATTAPSSRPKPARERFVSAEEYCALLTSRRSLSRADNAAAGVRGLRDRKTGEVFLIRGEALGCSPAVA